MTRQIRIERVESRAQWRAFLDFAPKIYRFDPCWVPPLRPWLKYRFRAQREKMKRGDFNLYLAMNGTEVAGTISTLRDRRHEKHQGSKVAFFGFFECVDDEVVAHALLTRAEEDARSWGADALRGPRNFSRVEEVGLLVDGHGTCPPMLASHTAEYYPGLVEGFGFQPSYDVLAYDKELIAADGTPTPLPERLAAKAAACDIPGLEIRAATFRPGTRDLDHAHRVFTDAFKNVPENTPMPRSQFASLVLFGIVLSHREMMQIALVNGEPAGFALSFPELNEAARRVDGRMTPQATFRGLNGIRQIRTASFKLLGLMDEYRGSGLHALLIARAIEGMRKAGFERVEGSLIDARNKPMRRVVKGAGMRVYRRYRLYEKVLNR